MYKKLLIFALVLLLLLAGCSKDDKPDTEPENDTPPTADTGTAGTKEEEWPTESYTEEQIRKKLSQIQICPSLAEQYALWLLEPADAPALQSALDQYAAWLLEHREALPPVFADSFWLLDQDAQGRWHLQAFDFSGTRPVHEWSLILSDGAVEQVREDTMLVGLVHAVCADETYDDAPAPEDALFQLRIADCRGDDAYVSFRREEGSALSLSVRYKNGMHTGSVRLDGGDDVRRDLTPPQQLALQAELELDWCTEELLPMVHSFLQLSFSGEGRIPWNIPAAFDYDDFSSCHDIRNGIETFLQELDRDETMAHLFLTRDRWSISGAGVVYTVTAKNEAGDAVTATVYTGGCVDMQTYVTPSRANILRLANSGRGAEMVPEGLRQKFVDYVIADYWYHHIWAGVDGTVEWYWGRDSQGRWQLTAQYCSASQQEASSQYLYDTITVCWNGSEVVFAEQQTHYQYGEK